MPSRIVCNGWKVLTFLQLSKDKVRIRLFDLKNLAKFLISIEIATRKWILEDVDDDEEEEENASINDD